jgi:hypothetical protein
MRKSSAHGRKSRAIKFQWKTGRRRARPRKPYPPYKSAFPGANQCVAAVYTYFDFATKGAARTRTHALVIFAARQHARVSCEQQCAAKFGNRVANERCVTLSWNKCFRASNYPQTICMNGSKGKSDTARDVFCLVSCVRANYLCSPKCGFGALIINNKSSSTRRCTHHLRFAVRMNDLAFVLHHFSAQMRVGRTYLWRSIWIEFWKTTGNWQAVKKFLMYG